MYLDKPLASHNLMQAIARMNRVYGKKLGGLIVVLTGLADSLADALATQRPIVLEIEGDRRLVVGNRELIERLEQSIGITLTRVRGHDETP